MVVFEGARMPAEVIPETYVRVYVDHGEGRTERLWAVPAGIGRVRLLSVSPGKFVTPA
jgi:hypothetical protein